MITISVCMIVKNEEKILKRCLDSIKGIWDELIIVDTGSTDKTKEIAKKYTDKVFDFEWIDDFSAARNYAWSKATKDYIYMADADEVIDRENLDKFKKLKKVLLPDIEIVQMNYVNQLSNGTVYNFDKEPRAKLYKRVREFTFVDPVHEAVRVAPVVFDSDIDIQHLPEGIHAKRDLDIFRKATANGEILSTRLNRMYARELLLQGEEEDFKLAFDYFSRLCDQTEDADEAKLCFIVLAEGAACMDDKIALLKYASRGIAAESSSELCCILGAFFEKVEDYTEASLWYYNARYETQPEVNLRSNTTIPLDGLVRVYRELGNEELAMQYFAEKKSLEF